MLQRKQNTKLLPEVCQPCGQSTHVSSAFLNLPAAQLLQDAEPIVDERPFGHVWQLFCLILSVNVFFAQFLHDSCPVKSM